MITSTLYGQETEQETSRGVKLLQKWMAPPKKEEASPKGTSDKMKSKLREKQQPENTILSTTENNTVSNTASELPTKEVVQ